MRNIVALMAALLALSCTSVQKPPQAPRRPHVTVICGDTLSDDYYWMRLTDEQKMSQMPDRQTADVLDFLKSENEYAEQVFRKERRKLDEIYQSLLSREKENDTTFPYYENGYHYYSVTLPDQNYPRFFRMKGDRKELYLDVNEIAEGRPYCRVSSISISPDNDYLMYCADFVGRNEYTLFIKDLRSGELLADSISRISYSAVWGGDSRSVYYVGKDEVTLRADKIYRHRLLGKEKQDELMYFESDPTFNIHLSRSSDDRYLFINCDQTMSDEVLYLDAADSDGAFSVFRKREHGVKYRIDHSGSQFYILTNIDGAKDFSIHSCPDDRIARNRWTEVVPEERGALIRDFIVLNGHLAMNVEQDANLGIWIRNLLTGVTDKIDFGTECYSAVLGMNREMDSNRLRINFNSMTVPPTLYEYDLNTKVLHTMKMKNIPNYDRKMYKEERIFAEAEDGTRIPISLLSRKDFRTDGSGKVFLYGYGAYGNSTNPDFDQKRFTLLDEGFVYAVAHIRGGSEMGSGWYEDGRMLNKMNTFTDFNDCARALIEEGYTETDLFAYGASAGGLLVTAVCNMEPDLYKGVIAGVPFTDVINTMMDETIPLTTFEWEEWGDPRKEPYYSYMLSYSPYDNIQNRDYPNVLVTSGFWDSQVQYWEPAKWVARMRERRTDDRLLLFLCDMESGHGGASGRYDRLYKTAKEYLFVLQLCR